MILFVLFWIFTFWFWNKMVFFYFYINFILYFLFHIRRFVSFIFSNIAQRLCVLMRFLNGSWCCIDATNNTTVRIFCELMMRDNMWWWFTDGCIGISLWILACNGSFGDQNGDRLLNKILINVVSIKIYLILSIIINF